MNVGVRRERERERKDSGAALDVYKVLRIINSKVYNKAKDLLIREVQMLSKIVNY